MNENNDKDDKPEITHSVQNGLTNPHDGLFKLFLQDKEIAKEFVELYMPEEYKAVCDINTLAIEPSSFVEADFTPYYNDILYSMNTINGEKGYVYALIEHQSSPDKMIAWRLFKYAMLAMDNHLKQQTNQNGNNGESVDKTLPIIVPILFYGGSKPHPKSISLDWFDLFSYPELARKIYNQPFRIINVNEIDDKDIMQHNRIGFMEYLYKHIRERDLMTMKDDIVYFLKVNILTPEMTRSILIYIFDQGKIEQPQQFIDALVTKVAEREGDNTMVSLSQYLHDTGFEKGIEKGIAQGITQGMTAGRQEGIMVGMQKAQAETTQAIARNMLKQKCDFSLIRSVTGLTDEEIKKLQL